MKTFNVPYPRQELQMNPNELDDGGRLKVQKYLQVMRCIRREIEFLRDMYFCDNIVTLDQVFHTIDKVNH